MQNELLNLSCKQLRDKIASGQPARRAKDLAALELRDGRNRPFPPSATREDDMGNLAALGQFLSGVGVLLLGVGLLWFVSVYAEKNE